MTEKKPETHETPAVFEPAQCEEIIQEFLSESRENLDRLDQDFVALEKTPSDPERLASIFRTVHTIKGTCGYLNFPLLGALTHAGETLLGRLRDGTLHLNEDMTTTLLKMVDAVRHILSSIEKSRVEGEDGYGRIIDALNQFEKNKLAAATKESPQDALEAPLVSGTSSALRVPVELLDRLMNLAGELVLARNHILKRAATEKGTPLAASIQQLNLVTRDLQEAVTKTRMQPVDLLWQKVPRLVRDLALGCDKKIRLVMSGADTDLDKTLLEAVKDPLLHAVRNAVDHGIENPQERLAQGKPAEGTLWLRAFHEAGQMILEIEDDGRGIDLERVKQKAIERGMMSLEQSARLSEQEILSLLFVPGFSTAENVTAISGRGVGMDVIKTNIEQIGGSVDIQNRPGRGTILRMRIPLTLAVIPALIVTCRGERYAIPQANVMELLRLDSASHPREVMGGASVVRLRHRLLPLVFLEQALYGLPAPTEDQNAQRPELPVAVVQINEQRFGLVVDAIHDSEEIVVKPLHSLLKALSLYSGVTIMGDGRAVLILDVMGLAKQMNFRKPGQADAAPALTETLEAHLPESRQRILLCEAPAGNRIAIPLSMVTRLEGFPTAALEKSAHEEVVLYHGQIMPLVRINPSAESPALPGEHAGHVPVIVYERDGRYVGLVVSRILDIVEVPLTLQRKGLHPGLLGSAEIQGRVTDILDVAAVAGAA